MLELGGNGLRELVGGNENALNSVQNVQKESRVDGGAQVEGHGREWWWYEAKGGCRNRRRARHAPHTLAGGLGWFELMCLRHVSYFRVHRKVSNHPQNVGHRPSLARCPQSYNLFDLVLHGFGYHFLVMTQLHDSTARLQVLDEELDGGLECTFLSSLDLGIALQVSHEHTRSARHHVDDEVCEITHTKSPRTAKPCVQPSQYSLTYPVANFPPPRISSAFVCESWGNCWSTVQLLIRRGALVVAYFCVV